MSPSYNADAEAEALVTIQTQPGWWDLIDKLQKRKIDISREDEVDLGMDDVGLLKDILGPVWSGSRRGLGPKDWTPIGKVVVGEAGMKLLLDHLEELPAYTALKQETLHLMMRDAAMPEHYDIDKAFDMAWMQTVGEGHVNLDLWRPALGPGVNHEDILDQLLVYLSKFETAEGWFEIRWHPWNAGITKALVKTVQGEGRVKRLDLRDLMEAEFGNIFRQLMKTFWIMLDRNMAAVDLKERLKWWGFWAEVRKQRPARALEARREMIELIKRNPL